MLQISINHPQQVRIGMLPAVNDRARQASLPLANEHTHSGIALCIFICYFSCAVSTVVVHDDDFVIEQHRLKSSMDSIEKNRNVPGFIESGNNKTKFTAGVSHI